MLETVWIAEWVDKKPKDCGGNVILLLLLTVEGAHLLREAYVTAFTRTIAFGVLHSVIRGGRRASNTKIMGTIGGMSGSSAKRVVLTSPPTRGDIRLADIT